MIWQEHRLLSSDLGNCIKLPCFFGRAHEERELRLLVKQPDAAARMRWLIAHGTPEGQMYGLYGLRLLKDPEFEQFASQLEEERGEIITTTLATMRSRSRANAPKSRL